MNLQKISELKYGWNGYKAEPFSKEHIAATQRVLDIIKTPPRIYPTANDSIQLEWETNNGEYLELQVHNNGDVTAFSSLDTREERMRGYGFPEDYHSINDIEERRNYNDTRRA